MIGDNDNDAYSQVCSIWSHEWKIVIVDNGDNDNEDALLTLRCVIRAASTGKRRRGGKMLLLSMPIRTMSNDCISYDCNCDCMSYSMSIIISMRATDGY